MAPKFVEAERNFLPGNTGTGMLPFSVKIVNLSSVTGELIGHCNGQKVALKGSLYQFGGKKKYKNLYVPANVWYEIIHKY